MCITPDYSCLHDSSVLRSMEIFEITFQVLRFVMVYM